MEELFSSNLFAIYIIACIAVITYTNFKENQRMFLLYLFTYATAFFEIFRISASTILLLLITFIFLEYLTEDTKKLTLITNIVYKIYDYTFMMFFQYHFFWILLSFIILHLSHYPSDYQTLLKGVSILPLFWGAHLAISQPFKIKSITDMCQVFETHPPYKFEYREEMQEKFDLLCAFEDKTYFQRKDSYSCISFEYIRFFLKNHGFPKFNFFKKALSNISTPQKLYRVGARLFKRGYSTPEMQLLRTIGILRGYDKYKIRRKIFEILYSKIVFSSLKEYHKANTYLALDHYRHYLLYVYFQTVMTKINGRKCTPLSSAFNNQSDISNWSMNGLFVACLGLSFREVSDYHLALFSDIIDDFGLSITRIKELNAQFPDKFPLEDTQYSLYV